MKTYVISLAAGLLVGIIYSLLNVRSPAPPAIALIGLLGILLGEQLVPIAKQLFAPAPAGAASLYADCTSHVLGNLPGRGLGSAGAKAMPPGDQP